MKSNNKLVVDTDEVITINVSVIGLSGGENVKGISGVGKSCLCQRLVEPPDQRSCYTPNKHSSIISAIDFYGSSINQTHWWLWSGAATRTVRSKKCRFHWVEHTVFIDDSSFREFPTSGSSEPSDFVKRATQTELRLNKTVYGGGGRAGRQTGGARGGSSGHSGARDSGGDNRRSGAINFDERFTINLFLLVFDVSEVDKRNPRQQESIFKQLFDAVIASKKPLIIVTTKNDILSQTVHEKFRSIIDKKPYNKYPVVETSSKLDINIDHIYDLAVTFCDQNGMKFTKQVIYQYSEGCLNREKENETHRREFEKLVEEYLSGDNLFEEWEQFIKVDQVGFYLRWFPQDNLREIFREKQHDFMLKRRGLNSHRFKEILSSLLREFDHLISLEEESIENIVKNLQNEKAFISHFIDFDSKIEYFKFNEKSSDSDLIPLCLLDANYEDNLLHYISQYAQQKRLEHQLLNHLSEDCQKYFRKSLREVRDDLFKYFKHFIPDKVVKNVYEKFKRHCLSKLQCKFLDVIHENPDLIWSQAIFKLIEIHPHKSWTINGGTTPIHINGNKHSNDAKHDDNSFLNKMVKEINKQVVFDEFPISQDDANIREEWIKDYLSFLGSKNEYECIIEEVVHKPCNVTLINRALSDKIPSNKIEELSHNSHRFFIAILGNNSKNYVSFKHFVSSPLTNLPLKICKVHSKKYEVEVISELSMVKQIFLNLTETNDRCSILCVIVLVDVTNEVEPDMKELENFLANNDSDILLVKYLICDIDISDPDSHDLEFMDFMENFREKYTVMSFHAESHHRIIDRIVSSAQKLTEQSVIWLITVCGDSYDYDAVVKFLLNSIKDFFLPWPYAATKNDITIVGSSNEMIIHCYRVVFMSYHQVVKLMVRSSSPPTVDAMILICSLDRLASVNTCFAIKKYLPSDIVSSCHCMLLGVGQASNPCIEQISIRSRHSEMEFGLYDTSHDSVATEEVKGRLFNFFKGILNNCGTLESINTITSNASSFLKCLNKTDDSIPRYLNKPMCQACFDSYQSDLSVYDNSYFKKFIFESGSYDEVLGDVNENSFNFWSPEFIFSEAQDICNKCTEVKCSIHVYSEIQNNHFKSFRTRIRSQSGPDLRNPVDFNQCFPFNSEFPFYCSICGHEINKSNNPINRQSFRLMRQNGTKETPQKSLSAKLHGLFNPKKIFTETQGKFHLKKRFD